MIELTLPTQSNISSIVNVVRGKIQDGSMIPVDMPTRHHFSQDIYVREIFMPAGSVVVGKVHATRHLNIILSGECTIWTVHGRINGRAGMIFESLPGVQKALHMITDVTFLTVHYNPDNLRDMDQLEGKYIQAQEQLDLFPDMKSLPIHENKMRIEQ